MSAAISGSVSGGFIRVIREPGFSDGASAIQLARGAESLGKIAPAIVPRLPAWVRFGPMTPGDTPRIVGQARQGEGKNTTFPRAAGRPGPPARASRSPS